MINNQTYIIDRIFERSILFRSLNSYKAERVNYDITSVVDNLGKPLTIQELKIGDIFILNSNNLMQSLYFTPNRTYPFVPHLDHLSLPNIFKSTFSSFRCFSYLTKDFPVLLVFCYFEQCLLKHEATSLKQALPSIDAQKAELERFIKIIEKKPFEEGFFKIFKLFSCFIRSTTVLVEHVNRNYESLCLLLDINANIINYRGLRSNVLNPSGKTRIFFLQVESDYFILYKQKSNLPSIISTRKTIKEVRDSRNSKDKTLENLSKLATLKKENCYKIFNEFLIKYSTWNLINQFHDHFLEFNRDSMLALRVSEFMDYKRCQFCESLTDLIELDCKHKVCSRELHQWFMNSTSLSCVFSKFQVQRCTKSNCGVEVTWEFFKKTFPQSVKYYCYHCNRYTKEEDMKISCKDICTTCAVELMIEKKYECSHHGNFTFEDISFMRSLKKLCEGCEEEYFWVKFFPKRLCKHFLCFNCISASVCPFTKENCLTFNITSTELKKMKVFQCFTCTGISDKSQFFIQHKTCECFICADCQIKNMSQENTLRCVYCFTNFKEEVISFLVRKMKEQQQMPIKYCPVCFYQYKLCDLISIMSCEDHVICKNCFTLNVESLITDINTSSLIDKCPIPNCLKAIPPNQLIYLISPEIFQRWEYFNMIRSFALIDCPLCRTRFESSMQRKAICVKKSCGYVFCKKCSSYYHEEGDCDEVYLQERIRDMMINNDDGVTQCPKCRIPYLKDPNGCQHVDCMTQGCGIDFCFQCACIRSPTVEHGNHYHRPSCPFFNYYYGEDDQYSPGCSECVKVGTLCRKPFDLRERRRVAKDEAIF